jgi:hypothetical protein
MKMQQVEIQSVGRLSKEIKDLNEAIDKSEFSINDIIDELTQVKYAIEAIKNLNNKGNKKIPKKSPEKVINTFIKEYGNEWTSIIKELTTLITAYEANNEKGEE